MKKLMQNVPMAKPSRILDQEVGKKGGAGLWVILALAVGIAAFLMLRQPAEQSLEVAGPALSEEDTTTVIEKELQATDLGGLETDINSLDADINQL